ncbi:endothelin-converting enzyme 1-like [Uloborus diversus]|uniref:endothelin-converting enzyme 1-like n=1 Tax=Uloborus diversus TaxID=327109 RepID=UPI00240A2510|nr:endothelin-converting enzyme 1-like [Uloborus diversus]
MSKAEIKWKNMMSYANTNHSTIRMTVKEFRENISSFDLLQHLQLIMSLKDLNQEISIDDEILVEDFSFIQHVISIIQSNTFSKRDLANLFGWFVLRDIYVLIPGVFKKYAERTNFSAQEKANATKNMCFEHVKDVYECSLEYLFVKNSSQFHKSGIAESHTLIRNVKSSFRKIIESSSWLDTATKQAALLKLDNMQVIAGFENHLNNKTQFDILYENFPPVSNRSLLETFTSIKTYLFSTMVHGLKRSNNETDWVLPRPVTDVSAYYVVQKNILALPLSMYHPPFYYSGGPWFLNFGAIGSIIGHELMHGFDSKGCRRGKRGSLEDWWSNSSVKIYNERTQCFKEQHISSKNLSIDQEARLRTLDENVADSEGLKMAFLAYKQHKEKEYGLARKSRFFRKYTSDQMFFISFASVWCSKISPDMRIVLSKSSHNYPELRVNGAVSNSEFFASTFHCPKGSPMNPHRKCSIW